MATELGRLEMQVLGLLDGTSPSSVADVRRRLTGQGSELAYTTVLTVLRRLFDKGVLQREKRGRGYVYWSSEGARAVKEGILTRMGQALFHDSRLRPIVTLLEEDSLDPDELKQLRALIDSKLRGDNS